MSTSGLLLAFAAHTVFSYWVVYRDGADYLEGWKAFFVLDWFAATLSAEGIRIYVMVSWWISLVGLLFALWR